MPSRPTAAPALTCLLILATALPARAQTGGPTLGDAVAKVQGGDFQGAVQLLEQVTRSQPKNVGAWSLLGYAHLQLHELDASIAAYETAAALPNPTPGVYINGALALARKGDLDAAFTWLERAKATGRVDVTGIDADSAAALLRDDPRYRALFPSKAELADPFVEPVRVLREWDGEARGDQFGWIARNIGDVDGDGLADVVTSAPTRANGGPNAGRIYVYSSGTGALLWTADGHPGDQLGLGVEAAGDVDADGVPDVIGGAPGADRAFVYSGRDGRVILTLKARQPGEWFGRKVGDIGDVDGDGHADVIVGGPRNDAAGENAGRAYVFSGRTGEPILTLTGEGAGDHFGSSAGGAVSADGRVTLVVGAPNAGPLHKGAVYVYHDLSGEPAFVIRSDTADAQLGAMFVSTVGDVDGDGATDVYASDWAGNGAAGLARAGRVYIHSGATGERLYTLTGEAAGDGFGIGVADAGDVDGDGHADLVIGAWQNGSGAPSGGKVYLYSGADGSLIRVMTGKVMGETFGFDATGMGDVDGDGTPDLLLTSAWSAIHGGHSGRMFIVSGKSGAPPPSSQKRGSAPASTEGPALRSPS